MGKDKQEAGTGIPEIGEKKVIKTVWIEAYTQQKGKWEEYEEPTGEVKTGMFGGQKPVTVKKKRWVTIPEYHEHLVDGARVSQDLESALNQLESDGFHILTISPVISGRYNWQQYDSRRQAISNSVTDSPDTAVSWGYSVTEGFTIVAKKN